MKPKQVKKLLEETGFFDKIYYLRSYHDARLADATPIDHFMEVGISENRKPNADFDPVWYLENYSDVKESKINPVIHFLVYGLHEGRLQNIQEQELYDKIVKEGTFDREFYKNHYEDFKKLDEHFDFITHYVRYGKHEGRIYVNPNSANDELLEQTINPFEEPAKVITEKFKVPTQFDTNYYLENNPDVAQSNVEPEWHYYTCGEKEGRNPNHFFETNFYYQLNADVRVAGLSAFRHFQENGYSEGRLGKLTEPKEADKSKIEKPLLFVGHDGIVAGAQAVLLEVVRWFSTHTARRVKTLLLDVGTMANEYVKYGEVYVLQNKQVDDVLKFKSFLNEEFEFIYLSTVVSGRFLELINENGITVGGDIIANIHEMEKVLEIFPAELEVLKAHTKHWISGSPETSKILVEKYNIPKEKLTTVPAFIDPITKSDDSENSFKREARELLDLEANAFVVMGCGTAYWRKGPDIFVDTAKKLKRITDKSIQFIWIGDGEDRQELEDGLKPEDKEYIHLIGHQDNAELLLAAADVFFLSSREDPFPLVVLLAAQHHVPTICFEEATGITEFVQDDAGYSLPSIDSENAAEAIKRLIDNTSILRKLGASAHERLFSKYTTEKKMIEVFTTIRKHTQYQPAVSVIIPFYNHENFIEDRLDSILKQKIQDFEIIALDDCSSDASVEKVKAYLNDERIKLYLNKINSGSPFKQWKKGITIANSAVVWIAEGDDSCSEDFLSQLLPYFDDQLINIAYAKTEMINEYGEVQNDAFKAYFEKAYPKKFDSSYIRTGLEEVNEQLGAMSTLVNASGLLIRKSSFGETLNEAQNFKMCGDWLIYLDCLKNGKIAYEIGATNYFRRHSASQVKKVEGTDIYFNERRLITEYVFSHFKTSKQLKIKAFNEVDSEWARFKYKNPQNELSDFYDKKQLWNSSEKNQHNQLPSIAVVASDFAPGGGQLFSIRLANALKQLGGTVIILNVGHFPDHPEVVTKIDKNIPVFRTNENKLSEILSVYDIDIVHSSIWWADKYVHENFKYLPEKTKWIVSMHGCYETLLEHIDAELNFKQNIENMLFEVDGWVYTAEKNKKVFEVFYTPNRLVKIVNGYEPELPEKIERDSIGIRNDSFVFCLASRAIETKGWYLAVEAADKLNEMGLKVDLLLIGEGEAKTELEITANKEYVHFMGQVSNLQDYIAISDVGLLPSFFLGESMPLVLIEFMAQGKPMISTNIGEIVEMTSDEEGAAALILELSLKQIDLDSLIKAMVVLCEDHIKYKQLSINSKRIFNRFTMSKMVSSYHELYGLLSE